MLSSSVATLYFDSYRTYCAVIEHTADAYTLTSINATQSPLDLTLSSWDELRTSDAFGQMSAMLAPLAGKVRGCTVATTMESVLAHQIPYSNSLTTDELRRLVRLEASEHLPHYDPSQFLATIYPLYGFAANPFMALSVLVPNTISRLAETVSHILNADLLRLGVAQTSAHAAFRYNYPEERSVVALIGLQRGYLDIAVVRNAVLLHTMTVSLEAELSETLHEAAELGYEEEQQALEQTGLAKLCFDALQEASESVQSSIDAAYFFGADLTKAALDEVQQFPGIQTSETRIKRLNPLRSLSTCIDERLKQYCARVGHILTPCIGAALPEVQSGIMLSSNLPSPPRIQRKIA